MEKPHSDTTLKQLQRKVVLKDARLILVPSVSLRAQLLSLPDGGVNQKMWAGQRIGVTDIDIHWNAPGVKGREGKIWGTNIAYYYVGFSKEL